MITQQAKDLRRLAKKAGCAQLGLSRNLRVKTTKNKHGEFGYAIMHVDDLTDSQYGFLKSNGVEIHNDKYNGYAILTY